MFKTFKLQNYNEFNGPVRWHDYFTIMINEFSVIQIRRYDWYDLGQYTFMVRVLGFNLFQKIGDL